MTQGRALYELGGAWDVALEGQWKYQPSTFSRQTAAAGELGYWLTPDFRIGGGYRFAGTDQRSRADGPELKRGFYFSFTSKLSNLFDLFGTSKQGLAGDKASAQQSTPIKKGGNQ